MGSEAITMDFKNLMGEISNLPSKFGNLKSILFNEYNYTSNINIKYPALVVFNTGNVISQNVNNHQFTFILADRLVKKGDNDIEIQNDMMYELNEIINYIYSLNDIQMIEDVNINLFSEQYADYLAGAAAEITIQLPNYKNNCFQICE